MSGLARKKQAIGEPSDLYCSNEEEKMEKKKPRRVPTQYQRIYRQTDKDLYDVRYNYKELNEDTGKTEYKTNQVGIWSQKHRPC